MSFRYLTISCVIITQYNYINVKLYLMICIINVLFRFATNCTRHSCAMTSAEMSPAVPPPPPPGAGAMICTLMTSADADTDADADTVADAV